LNAGFGHVHVTHLTTTPMQGAGLKKEKKSKKRAGSAIEAAAVESENERLRWTPTPPHCAPHLTVTSDAGDVHPLPGSD
jgi:hypothetical protein